jgi:DNA-binding IclR family transcriptional regulator
MTFMSVADAADLLRMEYAEMPGLALTAWQARRLCNLSDELADRALHTLLESGYLRQTHDGRYMRKPSPVSVQTIQRTIREGA